ncbi:SDR family oxidoreductase [Thermopolyspora sp. NPDC052614]|uniref:SDR family oxidoreductase n=1 Tax=Thermopolyspora sp. NPDC052614 TaxID=3155682 RepID=UPI0034451F60
MGALEGRTALVTGGSRGIGRAIVERLVADGAEVAFGYRAAKDAADRTAEACGGRAHPIQADLADPGQMRHLYAEAERRLGGLDILVNNAAISPVKAIADWTDEEYDHVMTVNAKSVFVAIGLAARRLRDNGRIISLSTLNTVLPAPGVAVYAASKAAVERFSSVAARELGPRGITVNTVSPGAVDTDMLHGANSPEGLQQAVALTALGRLGRPADIADVVAFLAGPDARWITGQNLRVSGGLVV